MRPSKLRLPERTAGDDQIISLHGIGDRLGQRAAVADARRAAVADGVEIRVVEVIAQSGFIEIIRHNPASRRQAGLDIGRHLQTFFDRLFRQQAGGNHHRRVAGVGAARDRGDRHVAVREIDPLIVDETIAACCRVLP